MAKRRQPYHSVIQGGSFDLEVDGRHVSRSKNCGTLEGLEALIDYFFLATGTSRTWYVGLVGNVAGQVSYADTWASHPTWEEVDWDWEYNNDPVKRIGPLIPSYSRSGKRGFMTLTAPHSAKVTGAFGLPLEGFFLIDTPNRLDAGLIMSIARTLPLFDPAYNLTTDQLFRPSFVYEINGVVSTESLPA